MPTYRYVAVGPDGEHVKSTQEATSSEVLRDLLLARNLEVVKLRPKRGLAHLEITKRKVRPETVMHFSRQLAAFVRSGIPLADAFAILEESTADQRFRMMLRQTADAIRVGVPLSEALEAHRDVFPRYYLGILRSAELTGNLDTVLDQLATYMDRDLEARSKVKSALAYPAVIAVMAVITVAVLVMFVLPRFVTFFDELDARLPLATRMLLGVAAFFRSFGVVVLAGLIAAGLVYAAAMKTPEGRRKRDELLLRIPLIGDIVLYAVTERFCRIVAATMRAGVPLTESMQAAIEATSNEVFAAGLAEVTDRMLEGEGMAAPIMAAQLFPTAASQMLRVGEETGTLDEQLETAAAFYGRELDYKLKKLTTLFEPAVIVLMGLIVGFVAVALVSAMYGVFQSGTFAGH
jgi:type IV pilus assembly protein PilC